MYQEVMENISKSAKNKNELFFNEPIRYVLHSAMAGAYIGLGIILILSLGTPLYTAHSPYLCLVMGASFGIALSLTMFAGSDLFTGNTMILPIGAFNQSISWRQTFKLLIINYFSNFIGSIFLAWIVYRAGIFSSEEHIAFLRAFASKKMGMGFEKLYFRGILCNWLVTLSVWCCYKMKSESGKLIMIFWCLFGFIGPGYEHSVANMTLLSLANFVISNTNEITWAGLIHNLIPVTLGNITSGAIFMGGAYLFISKRKAT